MMFKLLLALCGLGGLLAGGPGGRRQAPEAAIRFQIVNAGFTVTGTLTGLEATGQFDPAHLAQAHIQASVPVSSIQTGISLRDRHLQKPDYFDAEKYPTITMQSTSFRQTGREQYEGSFVLTMKGISHEVQLPFTVSATQEFRGSFRLNRLDYNLGKTSLILANDVTVSISGKLSSALPPTPAPGRG
ncbi:YceI family protein [Hymenobacter sp. HMF4947]|uniref:YceI family protein n=1 Tax=Hymenobacter ginkgonis TaxID=2682976 RepID=A0A7K1TIP5_9BACT|nr:YceI family protein [Hymenobacter ginkgonis]MVN78196.1 YceI family protein [Hymenobacter ginkgonis]